jgi:hypothetical protein
MSEQGEEGVVELLDELLMLEMLRGQRDLEPPEALRWIELQRLLSRELCEVPQIPTEKRQYLRVATPLTVRVVSAGTTFDATAIDLGAGGMGLRADVVPSVRELVMLDDARTQAGERFELGVPAKVVWTRKVSHELGSGFGVSFQPETRTHDRRVSALLMMLLRVERARAGAG